MLLEQLREGQIALLVATLQNVFIIADRLLRVTQQDEVIFWRHRDGSSSIPIIPRTFRL